MEKKSAPKDSLFRKVSQPVSIFAMINPATARPISPPAKNDVELSSKALGRCPSPTSCPSIVCLNDASNATAAPTGEHTYI